MNENLKENLDSYIEYLVKLPNGCQVISDYLREDLLIEAGKTIVQFTEGVTWLVEMNKYLVHHGIVPSLEEHRISEFLNEINSGLEIQDFVIVADMFEYEIKPFFENYIGSLTLTNS